ncbi:MAG: tetratricopeptide repeat protein, partial [Verrucomicrobiales bacterium]|nr:tetratricopeptide repeat protein [Verrucomicrobiales bacterium]
MARQLADEQLFVSSSVSESLALAWVKEIRGDAELPTVTKQRLLAIIESVGAGLGSGIARLSLIESGESIETVSTLDSQRETWEAVMWAGNHQHHWDQFMPFAQRFAKNGQHGRASALLTAMLQKIPRADSKRKKIARDLVAKMFTITSEFELDLDEGNPLAPLLRIGMLMQIGDRPAAVSQYMKQRKLFDERVKELPVSILLFAATIENETSSEAGWARSEDMLRLWLVHNNESQQATPEDQAAVQLLLAKTYFESGRYDIARSEYTTVLNQFPDTEAATDARFGVAQCYVEQKVFDKAEEIFTELRDSKLPEVNLRSEFMMGVMAIRQGDFDVAREMFQSVLERMPENALANETLYHLAEVFGIEQRFLDQLNMLRTIGRLGQQSKRWHTPGNSLFIVVHDSDLGISRGNSQIPVSITSDPGGDSEKVMLSSGSAGKGLFTAEIATVLAEATVDDGVLQITGADAIHVDYPEDFKKEFKTQLPQIEVIRIASDATFAAASRKIEAEKEETVTEQLSKEPEMIDEDLRKSVQRNASQIRPGNLIYLRVEDYDRDQGGDMDKVEVNLVASNGDKVTGELTETNPHSGVFEGTVPTAEMPAGATANGAAIDHEPLL